MTDSLGRDRSTQSNYTYLIKQDLCELSNCNPNKSACNL